VRVRRGAGARGGTLVCRVREGREGGADEAGAFGKEAAGRPRDRDSQSQEAQRHANSEPRQASTEEQQQHEDGGSNHAGSSPTPTPPPAPPPPPSPASPPPPSALSGEALLEAAPATPLILADSLDGKVAEVIAR
jgi:hypothetical protein